MGNPLILFGAGASKGSDSRETPPLGRDLFKSLHRLCPDTWGRLGRCERSAFERDFEEGMATYHGSATLIPQFHSQLYWPYGYGKRRTMRCATGSTPFAEAVHATIGASS